MIAESMYQELILEHYKHPQGGGSAIRTTPRSTM